MGVYYHLDVDFEAFKVKPFKDMLHLICNLTYFEAGILLILNRTNQWKEVEKLIKRKKNKLSHQHFAQRIERHTKRIAGEEGKFIPRKIPVETNT